MMPLLVISLVLLASGTQDDPPVEAAPIEQKLPNYNELAESYRQDLARAYLREVAMLLGSEGVTPDNFDVALELTRRALEWIPNDLGAWRVALDIARVARAAPGGRELERDVIMTINRLDPSDEVMRLIRLTEAINSAETAEGRLAGYDKVLTPQARQQLGPHITSRLVFEKALLLNRMGDIDGFARLLAEAVSIDPAFPAATEMAAGFFAARTNDLGAAAELLVAALVANPTKLNLYLDLGAVLMAEGAYRSAERIFAMAEFVAADAELLKRCDIASDLVLAQWGAGDPVRALNTIRIRIDRIDEDFRRMVQSFDPNVSITQVRSVSAPLPPMMSMLHAVLAREVNDPKADATVERMNTSFKELLTRLEEKPAGNEAIMASLLLDNLWVMLLLGGDVEETQEMLDRANRISPLSDEAQKRFDGWLKLRRGEFDAAVEVLQPLAADDNMARLGLGQALVARGNARDGARELLAVARAERGTALGLFAGARLAELVKVHPEPGPSAAALDAALAALPHGFDRTIENSRQVLAITIVPEATTYTAFQRILYKVTFTNRSNLALAIDPMGPLDARAAFSLVMIMIAAEPVELPVQLIPIDRRIELGPQQSLTVTLDISLLPFGAMVAVNSLKGMSTELRCVANFQPAGGRVIPGFMGAEGRSGLVRVDGVRMDEAWTQRTWGKLKETGIVSDPHDFAQMATSLTLQEDVKDRPRMLRLTQEWAELARAYSKYPPVVQAWIILTLTNTTLADGPFLEAARETGDPLVLGAYLLRRARDPADPVFDAARRLDNAFLHSLADSVQSAIRRRMEEMQRSFGIGDGQAPPSSPPSSPPPSPPPAPPPAQPTSPTPPATPPSP